MFEVAKRELNQPQTSKNPTVYQQLSIQLAKLNQYQIDLTQTHLKLRKKQIKFESISKASPQSSGLTEQQNKHLNTLASSFLDLNIIASSLQEQIGERNKIMSGLKEESEDIYDQIRSVTRRAD